MPVAFASGNYRAIVEVEGETPFLLLVKTERCMPQPAAISRRASFVESIKRSEFASGELSMKRLRTVANQTQITGVHDHHSGNLHLPTLMLAASDLFERMPVLPEAS
jgi:D-aminopeptidase